MGGIDKIIQKLYSVVEGNNWLVGIHKQENKDGAFDGEQPFVLNDDKIAIYKKHIKERLAAGKHVGSDATNDEVLASCDISSIKLPALKEFVKKYPQFIRETDN